MLLAPGRSLHCTQGSGHAERTLLSSGRVQACWLPPVCREGQPEIQISSEN